MAADWSEFEGSESTAGWSCEARPMTRRMGKEYFCANSKSRSSCAGTLITAPVPYSIST